MSESEIVQALRKKITGNLHVALPGIIEGYEFKEQRASIKIGIKQLYNSDTYIDYPILSGVPVIFPRSGGASITMPVVRGDTCLVMFLDKDLRAWLLGGDNLKPRTTRTHHLSDAVAIMGLSPFAKASQAENNTDVLFTYDGSQVRLKPQGVIDIHNAKEINIKTEGVVINCKTASVKAEESVSIECKTASIKSSEDSNIECKNANIKSLENSNVECLNASIKAGENISAACKNITIKSSENAVIECKAASIKAAESANIECVNAQVKAIGTINTETPNFTQKGDMKIEGNIEVTGISKLNGNIDSNATITGNSIKTSGGINLATHTHGYVDTVEGAAIPSTTQTPN